ncbi:multiprotein-bridging factor 1 family protein [Streptomyces sp. NPDC050585]|uniref:multiprotein-bridging factor 1 family protein n=1 Tax=Streptomyces sp. NPDC050585 TaxID=3365632 RepID=UPI0037A0B38B
MTQRQLGQRVGYDHSLVSRWESGTREPTRGVVDALERALDPDGALRTARTVHAVHP